MPPRRPPPLPESLFSPTGPLAPGSAPLPPSPSTIHPAYIIDGHSLRSTTSTNPETILASLPATFPKPQIKSTVQVMLDPAAHSPAGSMGVNPLLIHPTILDLALSTPPSVTNIAKGAVDIIVPCTQHLSAKEWDVLEEAVTALEKRSQGGKIMISGLLPPPLTKSSSSLHRSDEYSLHVAGLAQLSLHANVYLKALPPVLSPDSTDDETWWKERGEVERVVRMYLSPAIETFGSHRLIFGSSAARPKSETVTQTVENKDWYTVLRKCLADLGEDADAMSAVMGANAAKVYGLE